MSVLYANPGTTPYWGGGGGGNRFSDRLIPPKKIVLILDLANILHRFADLINTVDWSNILAQIVDFACNLVRILDCEFIVELLGDPNGSFQKRSIPPSTEEIEHTPPPHLRASLNGSSSPQ
jgi:hypothetical protein